MKISTDLLMLIAVMFLCSCTASTDQETNQEENPVEEEVSQSADSPADLPEENEFSYLFKPEPCDAISLENAASILGLQVDQVKVNANASGTNSCSWGYYPDDRLEGINLNVRLIHEEANTTLAMYEDDEKNRTDPVMESRRIEIVNPDLEGWAYSTYRGGVLRVYVSNDSYLEFQIGPAVPPEEAANRNYRDKVIRFAEAFMNR